MAMTLTLLSLFSISALAQSSGGGIVKGRIADEQGAYVPGAEVRLRSREGLQLFARTDGDGNFAFTGLGTGDYILEVTARGFAITTTDDFRVARGQTISQDMVMQVAAVTENVVVVATGTPQRADEVSKAVTLLDEEQIETRREVTLAEALRGTPGLRVQQQGSPGALTTLRLRGQRNFDTALLLDGLRVRDASDINGSALPFLTDLVPAGLDRVEILRGSGSSIYGTNAIGGVINLVPVTGAGDQHFETSFEGGGLALFRERLSGSGGITKRGGYSFGLSRIDVRRGVDGHDLYGNTAGGARVQFNPTPSITIGANLYGTISNALVNHNPRPLSAAIAASSELYPQAIEGVTFQPDFNNPDQGRRNRLLVGSLRWTQRVDEMFSYTLAYQRVSTRRRNYDGPEVDPLYASLSPFGDFEFVSSNRGSTDTVDGRVNLRLGRRNLVTAGFEYERESLFQETLSAFGTFGGATDRQRTFALFAQDQLFLLNDRLQISLGIRGQFYRINAADRPGFLGTIGAENSVTGDGSIAYFISSSRTKLRAHVGNGFRAPSLFERFGEGTFDTVGFARFGDATLRAEQSISFDGGFDQRLLEDRLMFGATYFYTRLQRVIDFTDFQNLFAPTAPPDPLGLGRSFGYVNFPGGLARGVETFLETTPVRGMEVRASYTFTNSDRFVPGQGLQQQFVIPKHLFGLSLSERWRAFLFSFDLNRTGSYLAPLGFPAVVLNFEGYTKADVFASYERALNERVVLVLFGGAENILGERYFENGFLAPGAVGRGGLSLRF